jgi:NodT family efflux transporter outer membrane factor (OMF) lipoprotein
MMDDQRVATVAWTAALAGAAAVGLFASGCASRHRYVRPPAEAPPAFKENAGWKPAQPRDAVIRGKWWETFGDPDLNALEDQIAVSNQTLKVAAAQYAQARAAVRGARSGLFPQVSANPSIASARQSGTRAISSFHASYADYVLPIDASYEADVWGRVRLSIEASRTAAQATAADLEALALGVHAELAIDRFALQGLDRERELLGSAVDAYEKALELTQNRYRGGIASQADVAQAETQLETTRAQAVDLAVERAAFEHAMAALVGRPASTFSVAPAPLSTPPVDVPLGVPSDLLERRPDIAGAERRVASASAQLGVASTAYYPLLTLSGATGFESSSLGSWLTSASHFWSGGPAALVTVFDAGRRHAAIDQAQAAYDQAVAAYQQTVLTAFREVEDDLATLRVLEEEAQVQERAVAASRHSLALAENRYRGGVATYLEVIAAQSAALANERAAVTILTRRMTGSVQLIKALGGGWH